MSKILQKPKVFFNASVILAGFYSPKGGSAKVLDWVKKGRVEGAVSEIICDEVLRRSGKIGLTPQIAQQKILETFKSIPAAPCAKNVELYKKRVVDVGDAHVLASSDLSGVDYLVTLDKKHLLVLKEKVKKFSILTPGELIEILSE